MLSKRIGVFVYYPYLRRFMPQNLSPAGRKRQKGAPSQWIIIGRLAIVLIVLAILTCILILCGVFGN